MFSKPIYAEELCRRTEGNEILTSHLSGGRSGQLKMAVDI